MKKVLTTLTLFVSLALTACGGGGVKKCEDGKHKFGKWEETTAATCTVDGVSTRKCTICGEEETKPIAAGHKYGEWATKTAATCKAEGVEARVCSGCQNEETRPIAKLNHTWNDGVVTKDATCSEPGVKTYTCTACGETKEEEILADHDFQPYEYTQGEGAVDAKVSKCSRDSYYAIDFNAFDAAATFSVSGDRHSDYVKLSKQGDGASTVEYKFYSPVTMQGRFWIAITGNTSNYWSRETKSGSQALFYTYDDTTTGINTWKNEVTLNGTVVDFDSATYNIKGDDIPFAELVYSDFGTLTSNTGTPILVPMPEMIIREGLNTLSFKRLTGYAFNMHTFQFQGAELK